MALPITHHNKSFLVTAQSVSSVVAPMLPSQRRARTCNRLQVRRLGGVNDLGRSSKKAIFSRNAFKTASAKKSKSAKGTLLA